MLAHTSISMPWWAWLMSAGGAAGSVGALIGMIRFLAKWVHWFDETAPMIYNISEQLKNNGGSSVKDKVDKLADHSDERRGWERQVDNRLSELETYIHARIHDIMNQIFALKGTDETFKTVLENLQNAINEAADLRATLNLIDERKKRESKSSD